MGNRMNDEGAKWGGQSRLVLRTKLPDHDGPVNFALFGKLKPCSYKA